MRIYDGHRSYPEWGQTVWSALVGLVMYRLDPSSKGLGRITYGDLAKTIGRKPSEGRLLAPPLKIIGWICLANRLPALNVVVVNAETGEPGAEVVLSDGEDAAGELIRVKERNWFAVSVPSLEELRELYESEVRGDMT